MLGPEALALRFRGLEFDDRLLLLNLGRDLYPLPNSEPLLAPPPASQWSVLWYSEQPRYGGSGIVPLEPDRLWRLTGHCAVVLAARPSRAHPEAARDGIVRARG